MDAWRSFLLAFREFERTRQGAAELKGIMPEEFRARFFSTDRAGHLAVEGHVARWRYLGSEPRELRLVYHVAIEPSSLSSALAEFESFARDV
ncbi:MAG: hypothetical protein ACJ76D_05115 [Solirubrobacterales bacterium]